MLKISKMTLIVMSASLFFNSTSSWSQSIEPTNTIYSTSIQWQDEDHKTNLLKLAPQWSDEAMTILFNTYIKSIQKSFNSFQNNVRFINNHWGPVDNPFVKYPRPVKAFVMLNHSKDKIKSVPQKFYMAPLVQSKTDHQYYVFDQSNTKPILMNEWVRLLQSQHPEYAVKFNVCHEYGNLPTEPCHKSYIDEVKAGINDKQVKLKSSLSIKAHRELHQNWKTYLQKDLKLNNVTYTRGQNILNSSIDWQDQAARYELLNTVTAWPNYKVIQANFEKIRDLRYFQDDNKPAFARRISWLYPDDGCWTRASAMIRDFFGSFNNPVNGYPRPSKVFAFGDLCANTDNSSSKRVSWWYHTAPIVKDAETNQTYVLDPSVNPYQPMTMENWAAAIASNSNACAGSLSNLYDFNICNGYGSSPYSTCVSKEDEDETSSMLIQPEYQLAESKRQIELGRDVEKVLGDLPPWKN
jgi:hypothetical protein